ncbi:MAG: prepilin-type N-terminal cleavage/methylation domain-containing protein [Thermodesulfovibrionales bacterium]
MTKMDNKGFSLVELLIAMVIGLIIVAALTGVYTGSLSVFKDVKSISNTIDTKTPSIELLSRYFERWGKGVASQQENVSCTTCPAARQTIVITTANGCSDVTFFGNLYGFGFVHDVAGGAANVISCRLSTASNQNCYILWRDNSPLNTVTSGALDPVGLSSLTTQNAECLTLTAASNSNAQINSTVSGIAVQAGDVIQRVPHAIRLYCASNTNDENRTWLYVDQTDQSAGYCTDDEPARPIAPVESFTVQGLPAGCDAAGGACNAVQVNVVFRSQSKNFKGQFDQLSVQRVFGR